MTYVSPTWAFMSKSVYSVGKLSRIGCSDSLEDVISIHDDLRLSSVGFHVKINNSVGKLSRIRCSDSLEVVISIRDDLRLSSVGFHVKIKYTAIASCPE